MKQDLPRTNKRLWVEQRDQGICAICQCDTDKTRRMVELAKAHLQELMGAHHYDSWRELIFMLGFEPRRQSWWEADHIHPLSEGGKDTMGNLRTLCLACHGLVTAALLGRLAKQNRLQRKQPKRFKYDAHRLSHMRDKI